MTTKTFKLPLSITIINMIMIVMVILSYCIPNKGSYAYEYEGKRYSPQDARAALITTKPNAYPIPKSFSLLPEHPNLQFNDIITAPFKGIISAIEIILFSLVLGAFLEILQVIGVMNRFIDFLTQYFKHSKTMVVLILVLSLNFISTFMGFKDEMIIFFPIILYITRFIGLSPMIALSILTVGVNMGVISSITNPFTIGLASQLTDTSLTDGIMIRITLLIFLTTTVTFWFIKKIKKMEAHQNTTALDLAWQKIKENVAPCDNNKPCARMTLTSLATGITVFGVVISTLFGNSMIITSSYFLLGVIIIGLLGGLKEKELITSIYKGVAITVPIGTIIGFTKGVSIIMDLGLIKDTLLHQIELYVSHIHPFYFVIVIFLSICLIGSVISSTSGMTTLIIPLVYPVAQILNIPHIILIPILTCAIGLTTMINPIGPFLNLGLEKTLISYQQWFRFIIPLISIIFILCLFLLLISIYIIM